MTPRSSAIVLLAVAVSVAATACGSENTSSPGSAPADPISSADPDAPDGVDPDPVSAEGGQCSPGDAASMARLWNDAALDAIRLDFPAPTVHARNLYHLSAAMWDVWRAYEPIDTTTSAVFVDEHRTADDVAAARDEAIAFAAHRVLTQRYRLSLAGPETRLALNNSLSTACGVQPDFAEQNPDSASAFGIEVADEILAATFDDGSLEGSVYVDDSYGSVNPPLVVGRSGTEIVDPDRWQPLLLENSVSQNGVPLPGGQQTFVGSQWGSVTPFAIEVDEQPPLDPGPPPRISDPSTAREYRDQAVEVIRASSDLQVGAARIDIGPGSDGVAVLDYESSGGHDVNPTTGVAYESNEVDAADYFRAIAEYWADGPTSETPPGHWNSLANQTSDALFADDATRPDGERLEWDVKLGLALNGALHDAAIAAWGNKGFYDSIRPISMIRWMAEQEGATSLPLVDGLVEVVTEETGAFDGRHAELPVGSVVVRSWAGPPENPEIEAAGTGWIRAVDWLPYQRPTFVTPAFAGYVSGHSVFSRAGAEVLTNFTGSEFFPGGMFTRDVPAGSLLHELGPTEDIQLQWATFRDAADEAGRSRIWGGIHIPADDEAGREIGRQVGEAAWARAESIFGAT